MINLTKLFHVVLQNNIFKKQIFYWHWHPDVIYTYCEKELRKVDDLLVYVVFLEHVQFFGTETTNTTLNLN